MSTLSQSSQESPLTIRAVESPLDSSAPLFPISIVPPRSTSLPSSPPNMSLSVESAQPVLGLRARYNPDLPNRCEWGRLAGTLTNLGCFEAGSEGQQKEDFSSPWAAQDADFTFELVFESPTLQSFNTKNQVSSLRRNALLLTPTRLDMHHRHQTSVAIQKFIEANKRSLGVIIYLMDATGPDNERTTAVQSLSALHHYLSMGFPEPPQVLVVSDASYLLDCVGAYMRGIARANPTIIKPPVNNGSWYGDSGPSPFSSVAHIKQ